MNITTQFPSNDDGFNTVMLTAHIISIILIVISVIIGIVGIISVCKNYKYEKKKYPLHDMPYNSI